MRATSIQQRATVADYNQLPEGAKYQLIEGEITHMPSPSYLHQKIVGKIFVEIDLALRDKKKAEAVVAPMDVHLDEENVYQPDIFLYAVARAALMQDHGFQGAPDVVIEVSSKGTVFYDYNKKFRNYEKAGVREYFIVDPEDKAVYRFDLKEGNFKEQFLGYGKVTSLIFGFNIDF
jgi:Uma2 family endonuclease